MYLYLTWAGLMDKMFRTDFLFFFWKKAAIECRRTAPGLCSPPWPGTNTLLPWQELGPDGRLLSLLLRCCHGKALLSREKSCSSASFSKLSAFVKQRASASVVVETRAEVKDGEPGKAGVK